MSIQLEKLLHNNYFLHQSARDGFRSYLQAYASYSLKKIFDVNALDLAKVGKAFGFSTPPRVNVSIGGGKSGSTKGNHKRPRNENESEDDGEEEVQDDEDRNGRGRNSRQEKQRRVETVGKKQVSKEMYKTSKDRRQQGGQWSR